MATSLLGDGSLTTLADGGRVPSCPPIRGAVWFVPMSADHLGQQPHLLVWVSQRPRCAGDRVISSDSRIDVPGNPVFIMALRPLWRLCLSN